MIACIECLSQKKIYRLTKIPANDSVKEDQVREKEQLSSTLKLLCNFEGLGLFGKIHRRGYNLFLTSFRCVCLNLKGPDLFRVDCFSRGFLID